MTTTDGASSHRCQVLGVRAHGSKAHAKNAANKDKTPGISRRVYKCEHCGKWHYEGSR